MGRSRKLVGERLEKALAWFAQYQSIPTFSQKAEELGVGPDTLRKAVTGRYPATKAERRGN